MYGWLFQICDKKSFIEFIWVILINSMNAAEIEIFIMRYLIMISLIHDHRFRELSCYYP